MILKVASVLCIITAIACAAGLIDTSHKLIAVNKRLIELQSISPRVDGCHRPKPGKIVVARLASDKKTLHCQEWDSGGYQDFSLRECEPRRDFPTRN